MSDYLYPHPECMAPDGAEPCDGYKKLLAEVERLENITALGVHTCNATCKRPMCVLRREKAKLEAEIEELNKFIAGQDEQISKLWKNRTL